MYGFQHHVEGEPGVSGNPVPTSSSRKVGGWLFVGALISACLCFVGSLPHAVALFGTFALMLLIAAVVALMYEPYLEDRISHWLR